LTVSASVLALGVQFASPAFAQTNTQQQQAENQNTAVDCSTITDQAQRANCVRTRGQNAPATAGAPEAGSIVITGSRIPKPNYDTIQPATVLSSQAIDQRGFVNAADALNELPQFGIPGSSPVGGNGGGAFGAGQSFVNFLGLGSQRTLVLVNGRRFISSNTPSLFTSADAPGEQVDLAQINTKLIDRIETIAIGGAPIYGSDAIAGTINIILKHDYQGFDLDGEDGLSNHSDANNFRVRLLAGHNFFDGRANLTASAEYNQGDGFTWKDRSLLQNAPYYDRCLPGSQFSQCLFPDGPRINGIQPGGVPLVGGDIFGVGWLLHPDVMNRFFGSPDFTFGTTDANGNAAPVFFGPNGALVPVQFGVNPGPVGNFDLFSSGGNGFKYAQETTQALADTQRYNMNLLGHFDISSNIRLFGEAWYAHSKSRDLVTQPEYNTGVFDVAGAPAGDLLLSVNNPFLAPDARALIIQSIAANPLSDQNVLGIPQDYFYLSRANMDIPTSKSTYSDDLYRFVVGLDGKFNMLAGPWNWEVSGNWGRSHATGRSVDINTQNFFNALGTITADNPNGVPCLSGLANSPFPTISETCAPFNPFGVGMSSQAAFNYIESAIKNVSNNRQFVFNAYVSGPVFRLPGGDLSAVVGVEHRSEGSDFEPDAFYHGTDPVTGDPISYGQTVPIVPIKGRFHTNEAFGELNADVISPSNNISFVHSLDFQAAARYVHHSVAGNAVTWTVGGRYAPIRDISLRGNFTRAIRSPSIQEAFIPTSTFFGFATDPCDASELQNGPDPTTRQQNCLAAGIPPTFQSTSANASFLQATGGNPNLKNEVSDAYSVGGVLTPRFVPGLNLSVDYIRVRLKSAISAFSATQVLDACYDSPNFATNPFCSLITRNANHQLTFVGTSYFNAAQLQYRGIVGSWDYKFRTPFLGSGSTIDLTGSYQHLLELSSIANAGAAKVHNEGTLGYPKDSFVATINYLKGPLSLFTNFNYTGPVDQGVDEVANFREHERIHSFLVVNGGGTIRIHEHFRLFADVDNIFNTKPPYPVPAFGGSVTYYPGVLGRYYRIGAGVNF
jgi:outer membrane receptor protein involved in Fe transport